MSDASHKQQNEQLLIAYLDGELDRDERLLAEKLLKENPELEDLVARWREDGDSIRALPRFRLDDSFADRVLAKIGDVSTGAPLPVDESSSGSTQVPFPVSINSGSGGMTWRIGVAAIVSISAVILLVFSLFPKPGDDDLAAGANGTNGAGVSAGTDLKSDIGSAVVVANPEPKTTDAAPTSRIVRPPMAKTFKPGAETLPVVKPVDPAELARIAKADLNSVRQVLLIGMADRAGGMKDLEQVCVDQSILVVRENGLGDELVQSSQFKDLKQSTSEVRPDAEAVLVIATAVQMKHLISQVSKNSRVQLLPISADAAEVARLDEWFGISGDGDDAGPGSYLLWVQGN